MVVVVTVIRTPCIGNNRGCVLAVEFLVWLVNMSGVEQGNQSLIPERRIFTLFIPETIDILVLPNKFGLPNEARHEIPIQDYHFSSGTGYDMSSFTWITKKG